MLRVCLGLVLLSMLCSLLVSVKVVWTLTLSLIYLYIYFSICGNNILQTSCHSSVVHETRLDTAIVIVMNLVQLKSDIYRGSVCL